MDVVQGRSDSMTLSALCKESYEQYNYRRNQSKSLMGVTGHQYHLTWQKILIIIRRG